MKLFLQSFNVFVGLFLLLISEQTHAQTPVASYLFTSNANDASVNGNNATVNGATATQDRFNFANRAFAFDGIQGNLLVKNATQLNTASTTISFWVKVNALPLTGEAFILSHGGWQERWKISLPSHGKPVFTTNAVGGIKDTDTDSVALPVGAWRHLVMTHDGVTDKIYVNGVLKNSKAATGALNNTTKPFGIGFNPIDTANYFNGSLDDIMLFNTALTAAEITALYTVQSAVPTIANARVAAYSFNGTGFDSSAYANHATLTNVKMTTDRFGFGAKAYEFGGVSGIKAANSAALNSPTTTVSFWVRVNALPASGEAFLFSYGGWQERLKVSVPSHGKVVFTTNYAGGISDMDAGDGNALPVGIWKHVVVTHDGANDKIFIDGVRKATKAVVGNLKNTTNPLGIGYDPIDNGAYFNGAMDEIQVYNYALTEGEVTALYAVQSISPAVAADLVADYSLNSSGRDASQFSNTATGKATATANRFNYGSNAMTFNGVNDSLIASNSVVLQSDFTTISFWIKVNALPVSGEAFVLSHGGWQERWKISLPSHGKPVFTTNSVGGIKDMDSDSVSLPVGAWRHVVMTHDLMGNKIFINGQLKKSIAATGALNNTTRVFGMGYDPIDSTNFFNGALDDIQIYNVALTDVEVAALFALQNVAPVSTDVEAPSTPLSISAVVAFTNVTLSWLPSTDNVGVTSYNVFRNNVLVVNSLTTSALITGLAPTTRFTFGVTAIDAAGNQSAMSTLQVTTGQDAVRDTIAPSVPSSLTAQIGSNSVQLAWIASTDNRAVKGYIVFQDGVVIDTVAAPNVTKFVGGLLSLTAYTFEVLAYDVANNKSAKAERTVTTLAPVNTGEPGLIANYPFDDNANDATPYNNHGAIGGNPTFVVHTGLAGKALKFDGNGDSVLVKNAVQLISDFATVGFWIRVDSVNIANAEAYVIDFGHWDQRWKISLPQHLRIVWTTNCKNTISNNFITDMDAGDGNELVKGIWWHVTAVHDGVNNIIYINGVETKRVPSTGKLNSTARALFFGNNGTDGGQYFAGALDNVKIYNKAMTAGEINKLFRTGSTPVDEQASGELLALVKSISPNPVSNELLVKHAFTGKEAVSIRIFDLVGRQVDALNFEKNNIPSGQFSLNTSRYLSGTYLINFVQDGKSLGTLKFVKN